MTGFPLDGWLAVCGLKREAAIWGGRAVVGGGRSDLLAVRLEAAIAEQRPRGLISFGVAGALSPALAVGDGLIGIAVVAGAQHWLCDPEVSARLARRSGWPTAVIAGSDRVLTDPASKHVLVETAAAVDMESHVAARVAAANGLPLAVIRVVSDGAGHSLPPAAVAGMDADGGVDVLAVLTGLARHPRQLPDLIRMGRGSARAFGALATARRRLSAPPPA